MKKLCLLLAGLLLVSLCGCESGLRDDKQDDRETLPALTAEEALDEALDALTGGENPGYPVLLGADGQPATVQNTGVAMLLSSHVTCKVTEFTAGEDTATAQVKITAPDSQKLLTQALDNMASFDEEALYTQIEALLKNDPAMVSDTVQVQLVYVEGHWCVVPDFALSNALTGGLTQAYMDIQAMLISQLQKGGEGQ